MVSANNVALLAYVASPHAGYLKLFRGYAGSILYVLGNEFIQEFPSLVRHLPGVTPGEACKMIKTLGIFSDVRILTPANLEDLKGFARLVMPDEDVSHAFVEKYLEGMRGEFDGRWRLRWDWGSSQKKMRPEGEGVVSREQFARDYMRFAFDMAKRSPDWWRQIGALLVDEDGGILLASFNQHMPGEQSAYLYGDPRSSFEQGQCIEVSGAGHAEPLLFAEACRRGIKTEGCDFYVSTFPCPPCAYMTAHTGIKRLFYAEGYSLIAGAETLQTNGVEIIRVEM